MTFEEFMAEKAKEGALFQEKLKDLILEQKDPVFTPSHYLITVLSGILAGVADADIKESTELKAFTPLLLAETKKLKALMLPWLVAGTAYEYKARKTT